MASPYYQNPELYGLRRSTRSRADGYGESNGNGLDSSARYTEYTSDSDSDAVRRRRKSKPKTQKKKRNEEEFYESNNEEELEDPEPSPSDSENDEYGGSAKRARKLSKLAKTKKRLKLKQQYTDDDSSGFGTYTPPTRFSNRQSKMVNYTLDENEDDADLLESDEELVQSYVYEPVETLGMCFLSTTLTFFHFQTN